MTDKVAFELVTPSQVLYAEPADMVVAPGADGNFGILPGHAPLLSTLRPGVIDVYEGTVVAEQFFISGGFAEVNEAGFTILAEDAVPVADLDAADAQARLDAALEALSQARTEDEDVRAAEAAVTVAEAMVEAAG